jgi:hypothetical protein
MTDPAPALFVQLGLPETDVARKAYAFAKRATPEFVLNHSIRSYVFARAHAARRGLRPGTDYDDELVFLSCILHGIGLSEDGNGDQRFEVDGADTAARFLREHGVEERRVAIAWDAIALHTSPGIANRKATEVAMSQAGIATDIIGAGREELPAGLAEELHAVLPRADLAYALSDAVLVQATGKPQKANPLTFAGVLLRHHLPYGAYPGWYDLIGTAGWGDKPVGAPARRRAETPEQVAALFTEYLETGDLDGLVSLYEPNAHFVAALQQMIDSGTRVRLEPRNIRRVDDLALVSNIATVTEATPDAQPIIYTITQILRRQPDGGWVHVLDDSFFG